MIAKNAKTQLRTDLKTKLTTIAACTLLSVSSANLLANPMQKSTSPGASASQQQQMQQKPVQQQPTTTQVSDKELGEFANVQDKFTSITKDYETELSQVKEPEKASAIQSKFQAKVTQVIQDSDLSPERYNEIRMAITSDSNLQKRYMEKIAK
ncbi:MAG: DUF4168 domain-containing protein [Oligoflexus sp.]